MSPVLPRLKNYYLVMITGVLMAILTPALADENTAETAEIQPQTVSGSIARAMFTSEIVDREPVDELTELSNASERVYYFTDLRGMTGQIITHQWEYAGNVMADVKFRVGEGPRWRVYSSKNLLPTWTGEWTVTVLDENGSSLNVGTFTYTPAPISEEAPGTETPPEQPHN